MPTRELTTKPLRAAIYVRVSSERQAAEDRVSVESQLAECEEHCDDRGYIVVGRYIDKDKYRVKGKLVQPSGSRKDRPAYLELLEAAQRGEFEVIVAWKEDRLYRGMYAAVPLSELLDEMGQRLQVELVREVFDRRMLGIKAALGKIEVENIRERMIMGRRARLERGEVPGGDQVKYGYKRAEKHLQIDEQEASMVRNVFEWYIGKASLMEIRRKLNASGIAPRRGRLWSKPTIEKILTFEGYATAKVRTTLDGESFDIPCPPIISLDTWYKAVEVRHGNKRIPRHVKRDYLCLGLVYCSCGWKCQARTNKGNLYRGYQSVGGVYTCQRRDNQPEFAPDSCVRATGSQKIDHYVWDIVKEVCVNQALVKTAVEVKLSQLQDERNDVEQQVAQLRGLIREIEQERQWVITQARKKRISERDMDAQLDQIQQQEWRHRRELEHLESLANAKRRIATLSEWVSEYLQQIRTGINALDTSIADLGVREQDALFTELEAWRFQDKFPDDKGAQLQWAILEEKRRAVRAVIDRVIVGRDESGKGRTITPILAIELPSGKDSSLASSHQSAEYINPWLKVTVTSSDIDRAAENFGIG